MAYEPTEWKCGDTITAEKLNHMEDGIAQSGTTIIEPTPKIVNGVDINNMVVNIAYNKDMSAEVSAVFVDADAESFLGNVWLKSQDDGDAAPTYWRPSYLTIGENYPITRQMAESSGIFGYCIASKEKCGFAMTENTVILPADAEVIVVESSPK